MALSSGTTLDMTDSRDLVSILLDKDKAREALPELHTLIQEKRRELDDLQELYDFLRRKAGLAAEGTKVRDGSTTAAVIGVLEDAGRPMSRTDVVLALGPDVNAETVSWALYDAARRKLIRRTGRGMFASLEYQPGEQGTLVDDA